MNFAAAKENYEINDAPGKGKMVEHKRKGNKGKGSKKGLNHIDKKEKYIMSVR